MKVVWVEVGVGARVGAGIFWHNTGSNIEVARLQIFNRKAGKVLEFLIAYRSYIKIRMREATIEDVMNLNP